jgi:hypothetical protein
LGDSLDSSGFLRIIYAITPIIRIAMTIISTIILFSYMLVNSPRAVTPTLGAGDCAGAVVGCSESSDGSTRDAPGSVYLGRTSIESAIIGFLLCN